MLIVGGGSNLVVGDDGWDGVVVLVRSSTLTVHEGDDIRLLVDAGVGWDDLVARSVEQGWSGLAAMSGIPGLTGATPIQNVGAYGREVAEVITSLTVLDRRTGVVEQWPPQRCEFGFRTSAFKHTDRYVVLQVAMALHRSARGPAGPLRRTGPDPRCARSARPPRAGTSGTPSCGCAPARAWCSTRTTTTPGASGRSSSTRWSTRPTSRTAAPTGRWPATPPAGASSRPAG